MHRLAATIVSVKVPSKTVRRTLRYRLKPTECCSRGSGCCPCDPPWSLFFQYSAPACRTPRLASPRLALPCLTLPCLAALVARVATLVAQVAALMALVCWSDAPGCCSDAPGSWSGASNSGVVEVWTAVRSLSPRQGPKTRDKKQAISASSQPATDC